MIPEPAMVACPTCRGTRRLCIRDVPGERTIRCTTCRGTGRVTPRRAKKLADARD